MGIIIVKIVRKNSLAKSAISKSLFWDVDVSTLDPRRHANYVIERVLEYGDSRAARWLLKNFSRQAIAKVIKNSRRLSPKSRNFWALKMGLWLRPTRRLTKKHSAIWKR